MKVKNRPDHKKGQIEKNKFKKPKNTKEKSYPATNGGKKAPQARKGQWNMVPVGEEYFTDKEFEILVSFEELLDYDVETNADGTKEILSVGKPSQSAVRKKRKESEEVVDEEVENITKKKRKSKKSIEDASLQTDNIINTSAGIVIVEEDKTSNAPVHQQKGQNGVSTKKEKPVRKAKMPKTTKPADEPSEDVDKAETCDFDYEASEWTKLGVPEVIVKSLIEKNFKQPTAIQVLSLPAAILGKKDIVGAAETGSGKTLAFAIPIIDGILKFRKDETKEHVHVTSGDDDRSDEVDGRMGQGLSALILTPTRELAVQIKNHFDVAAKYANLKTVVIVGGLAAQKQERLLRGKPDVVIATPGRLWELVQEGDPHLSTLNQIKYLAIDETDRMVERGHFKELEGILGVINQDEIYKERRQNFIFSATLAFTHEPPQRLKMLGNKRMKQKQPKKISSKDKLKQIMEMVGVRPNPKIVDITTSKGTCETLIEAQITCSQDHKDYYLYYFLTTNPGRTIVFCNSINCVRRLTNLFFLLQCGEVLPLHSEMHQKQRLRNLERFTADEKGILIATDVAARGLDIQNIEHVIHYQVPKTAEGYIHRSGRTARAFKGGLAILMIEPAETTTVKNIFRSLGRDEKLPPFDVDGKTFRELKNTVEMGVKVEKFEHSVRKKLADHSWMEKAKKDMDLASSSEESDDGDSGNVSQKKSLQKAKKQLDSYKQQLSQLLSKNAKLASSTT